MCELFAMSANRAVSVCYEMDRFAAEGGELHQNRDGWGIMFAEQRDAHLYREAAPASTSLLDRFVREHQYPSHTVLAHVRRASHGEPVLANTHPFRRVRNGRAHHFAHNGTLTNLHNVIDAGAIKPECVGDTDSEQAFLVLLEQLGRIAPDVHHTDERFAVFTSFAREMAECGSANMLFFDSHALYVHADKRVWESASGLTPPKPPGLHILELDCSGTNNTHACAIGKIEDLPEQLVMFASVPLNDEGWTPLPLGTTLAIRNGVILERTDAITSG